MSTVREETIRLGILTDGSREIGGGHLLRCLSLAEELAARNVEPHFFVGSEALQVMPSLAVSRLPITIIDPAFERAPAALMELWPQGADAIVIDKYDFDVRREREMRGVSRVILVMDERLCQPHEADILLDSTHGRLKEEYRSLVPSSCELAVGGRFALLRRAFAKARRSAVARRMGPVSKPMRILISLGLTDPDNVTAFVLEALDNLTCEILGDVVVGGGAPHLRMLEEMVFRRPWARLAVDPPAIWQLMSEAALAVGGAGVTAWERCCLGLPSIVLTLADNQEANAQALEETGGAIVLGTAQSVPAEGLRQAVLRLLSDEKLRTNMVRHAAAMVDGKGAARVADLLIDRIREKRALATKGTFARDFSNTTGN